MVLGVRWVMYNVPCLEVMLPLQSEKNIVDLEIAHKEKLNDHRSQRIPLLVRVILILRWTGLSCRQAWCWSYYGWRERLGRQWRKTSPHSLHGELMTRECVCLDVVAVQRNTILYEGGSQSICITTDARAFGKARASEPDSPTNRIRDQKGKI